MHQINQRVRRTEKGFFCIEHIPRVWGPTHAIPKTVGKMGAVLAAARCVKREKTGEEKNNCTDSASHRRAGKILARTGRIPSASWICLEHRNEMHRTTNDVHVHRHGGPGWPKYRSQTACTRSLTKWENLSKLQTWKKLVH